LQQNHIGINVIIEKLINQFDDTGHCLDLLSRGFWVYGGERLDFAALEANVKLGGSFRPCDQPLVDSFVEDELIVLSVTFAHFAGIGQYAKLLVPFTFERVGDDPPGPTKGYASMAWSFSIGRLFGSQIRVHVTFFLLLAWIGFASWQQGGTAAAMQGILFIIAIFACVVAHEYGHALMARRFGIRTLDITLLPIGGLARLEKMPEEPRREIAVALAGPAVNLVIAAVLIVLLGARVDTSMMDEIENPAVDFLARLANVNLFLALFNLVPAFPMDGGRVLRALLAMKYSRTVATRYAALAGQALAFGFGFLGLAAGNPLLVFVAIFIYLAATAESNDVAFSEVARGMTVRDGMITAFEPLALDSTLADAAEALIRTTQQEFPVLGKEHELVGFLTRSALFRALSQADSSAAVEQFMARDIPTVTEHSNLEKALEAMRRSNAPAVGVLDGRSRLVAYITPENLGELMIVRRFRPDTSE
jgi:Zn-dependent protease/CBS domain-containing protein